MESRLFHFLGSLPFSFPLRSGVKVNEKSGQETVSLFHFLSSVPLLPSSFEWSEKKDGKESEKEDEQAKKGRRQRDCLLSVPLSLSLSLFSFPPGRTKWNHASSTFSVPFPSPFLSGMEREAKRSERKGRFLPVSIILASV